MQKFLMCASLAFMCSGALIAQAEESELSIQARHDQLLADLPNLVEAEPFSMYMSYRSNEYAADAKYKGQWINVKGYVDKVRPDFYSREPVVDVVSAKGMTQSVTLKLFSYQITSHDDNGYYTASRQQTIEGLTANMPVVANCQVVGKSRLQEVVLDNCLIYTTHTYNQLYQAK